MDVSAVFIYRIYPGGVEPIYYVNISSSSGKKASSLIINIEGSTGADCITSASDLSSYIWERFSLPD